MVREEGLPDDEAVANRQPCVGQPPSLAISARSEPSGHSVRYGPERITSPRRSQFTTSPLGCLSTTERPSQFGSALRDTATCRCRQWASSRVHLLAWIHAPGRRISREVRGVALLMSKLPDVVRPANRCAKQMADHAWAAGRSRERHSFTLSRSGPTRRPCLVDSAEDWPPLAGLGEVSRHALGEGINTLLAPVCSLSEQLVVHLRPRGGALAAGRELRAHDLGVHRRRRRPVMLACNDR